MEAPSVENNMASGGWRGIRWMSALAGLAALALGILAQTKVKADPMLGLWLFAAAGLLLALCRPNLMGVGAISGELPGQRQPLQRWEPWFLLLLLVLGFAFRFYGLADFPIGAHGHEGEMAAHSKRLESSLYIPHVYDDDILWPSTIFYQGMAFAKWFGWSQESFRMPAAIWSLLSLPLLYFLIRLVAVPWVAAVGVLLFNASQLQLALSRNFFPGSILFVAPVAAFAFLLMALRDKRWNLFLAAGFAAGLSLHAYVPGRPVGILFALWFFWLYLVKPGDFPGLRMTALFFAGYLMSGAGVIWWAATNWDHYWTYVGGHNPYAGSGVRNYVLGFIQELPTYARWLHVQGDPSASEDIPYHPGLDPVAGVLFPLGFFFCAFLFWRPVHAFVLALLVTALAPAIFGGGFAHPTGRRLVMALPAIYFLVALGLERIRLLAERGGRRWATVLLLLAAFGAAAWSNIHAWNWYFKVYSKDPYTLQLRNVAAHQAGQEMKSHPGLESANTPLISGFVATAILFPRDRQAQMVGGLESVLLLKPKTDQLLLTEGWFEWMLPEMKALFPSMQVRSYVNPTPEPSFGSRLSLLAFEIPRADLASLHGLQVAGQGPKLPIFEAALPREFSSGSLRLEGSFFMPEHGGDLTPSLAWKGWTLKLDGRVVPWGRATGLSGGLHDLTLERSGAGDASGAMPLSLATKYGDLVQMNRVLATRFPHGVIEEYVPYHEGWDGKASSRRREPVLNRMIYDITPLPVPYFMRSKAMLSVPVSGSYRFSVQPMIGARLKVASKLAYDNSDRGRPYKPLEIQLQAGEPVPFVGAFNICPSPDCRMIGVLVQGPGMSGPEPLPNAWLSPQP